MISRLGPMLVALGFAAASLADVAWTRTFSGPTDATYGLIRVGGDNILKCQGTGSGLSPFIDAYNPAGDRLWHAFLPGPARQFHAGADGFTFACGSAGSQGAYVRSIRPDGSVAWTYLFNPDPNHAESFSSLRVEGNNVWVLGTQNAVRNGQSRPVSVCVRLNATTGQPIFVRTYPIWADCSRDEQGLKMINNADAIFLLVGGVDWHSLIRINPLTSSALGRVTVVGKSANDAVVDSVSQVYISAGREGSIAKVDASGAGSLPIRWSGVAGGQKLLLLKSFLWATQNSGPFASLRRVSAAGDSQVVLTSPRPSSKFAAMATEIHGRLFLTENWIGATSFHWQNLMFDPGTLVVKTIEPVSSAETQMGGVGLSVAPDGTTYSSGRDLGPLLHCSYRTPAPVQDVFSAPKNGVVNIAAPGLMANDVDVDPAFCKTYISAPPAHGSILINSNGSFRYTPTAGFAGVDTFTYRVRRGSLQSTAQVTMQVTP